MLLIAVAVSIAAVLDYQSVGAAEEAYRDSGEVLNLAGRQRMLSQRLTQLGVRLAAGGDRESLATELASATEQLQQGQARLQRLPTFAISATHAPELGRLLKAVSAVQQAEAASAATAAEQLAAEAEDFLLRMEVVVNQVQRSIESAGRASEVTHAKGMTALALAISVLALGSGEWLARRIARQHVLLRQQTAELERLALVAERTHNAVAIADAEGRLVWANEGFTRITGYPLADVLGKRPGSLLQFEGTDPATIQRIRAALAAHEPVQVQILNRGKHGRVYWVHLDIQPMAGPDGRARGFVAVETDITEQVQEREHLASVLRALPVGVVQTDGEGRVTHVNPEASRMLGVSMEQARQGLRVGAQWQVLREDGSPFPAEQQPAAQALRTGVPVRDVTMGLAVPEGERRWLRVNAEPVRGPEGKVSSVVSSFADITEVSAQRRLLSLTVEAAGLGTWDWQIRANRVHFNDQWWQMLGYRPGDLPESFATWEALVHPEDLPATMHALQLHVRDQNQSYRCEFRMRRAGGDWAWIMAAGAVTERDAEGAPWRMAGIHMDITQRKVMEQRLEDAALTDALTGLPNRTALLARLTQCASRAARDPSYVYALLFMDFDRFKQVNDTLGHDAGDELLRQIAQRLRTTLRPGDDLARLDRGAHTAARLGGDEFVALLEPLARRGDASIVAQRLLDALAEPYTVGAQQVLSTVSIGIVTSERTDRDPEALLRDADIAMYAAKRRGRARFVVFSDGMH